MSRKPNQYILQKKTQLHREMLQLKQFSNQMLEQYEWCKYSGGLVFFSTKNEKKIASTYQVLNNTFPALKQEAKEMIAQLEMVEKMLRRSYNPKNSFPNKNILDQTTIRSCKKRLNELIHSCEYCLNGTKESADKSLLKIDFSKTNLPSPSGVPIPYPSIEGIQKDKESFQNHFGLNNNYAGILLNAHLLMTSIQRSKSTLRTLTKL